MQQNIWMQGWIVFRVAGIQYSYTAIVDIGSNMFLYYQDLEFSKTVLDLRTPPAILKISASSYQLQPYGFKVFSYNQENFFLSY